MTVADIILAALRLILALVQWAQGRKQFDAGQDAEIAAQAAAILAETQAGAKMMEKINALPDADVDKLLHRLEFDS